MNKILKKNLFILLAFLFVISFSYVLSSNINFTFANTLISVEDGASIRVNNEETSGLRFKAIINKVAYDELVQTYGEENVKAGMIIVPTSYVNNSSATLEALENKYGVGNIAYKDTISFKTEGENYVFYHSLISIKDNNYTRDFSGIAYIRISSSAIEGNVAPAGASLYDGYYYIYASYNEEVNSRNVYSVACSAYEDEGLNEQKEIIKKYIDGVLVLQRDGSEIVIGNNTEKYTSPYSISKDGKIYSLDLSGKMPKEVLYNGERRSSLSFTDSDLVIDSRSYNKASVENEAITLESVKPVNASTRTLCNINNGYVALLGKYGVGTYISVDFVGNNMPSIALFADKVTPTLSGGFSQELSSATKEDRGLVLTNGIVTNHATYTNVKTDGLYLWAPYKYTGDLNGATGQPAVSTRTTITELSMLSQDALSQDNSGKEYRYTVGSFLSNGTIWLDLCLVDLTNNKKISSVVLNTKYTTQDLPAGNIILYAPLKGGESSTFNISGIYDYSSVSDEIDIELNTWETSAFAKIDSAEVIYPLKDVAEAKIVKIEENGIELDYDSTTNILNLQGITGGIKDWVFYYDNRIASKVTVNVIDYVLRTEEQFNAVMPEATGGLIVLGNDIVFTEKYVGKIPVYDSDSAQYYYTAKKDFNGVFDGRGYSLINFTVSSAHRGGIFYNLTSNAVVKNIAFENAQLTNTWQYNNLIAYDVKGGLIENIYAKVSTAGKVNFGVIAQYSRENAKYKNIVIIAESTGENATKAGLFVYNADGAPRVCENVFVSSTTISAIAKINSNYVDTLVTELTLEELKAKASNSTDTTLTSMQKTIINAID